MLRRQGAGRYKKSAELRPAQFNTSIRYRLDEAFEIEFSADGNSGSIENVKRASFLFEFSNLGLCRWGVLAVRVFHRLRTCVPAVSEVYNLKLTDAGGGWAWSQR